MRTALIFVISFFIAMTSVGQQKNMKADTRWNLVYANDENGNKLSGDLDKLIALVKNGEPIRISWTIEHPTNKEIKIEHFADAKFITIMSDSVVFAQIDPIIGQVPSIKDRFITFKENIEWAFSASSLGNNDSMNLNLTTGEILDHKPFKCGIKWFTKGKIENQR
jgi:hypothetical protein